MGDKAIDVLDEAGSRVRLENKRLPEGILLLLNELQETLTEKEIAVREQDFETASQLLDYEMEVRIQVQVMKQALQINDKIGLKRSQIDMDMEEDLHERIIGQPQAIVSVSKAIRRARVGLRNP